MPYQPEWQPLYEQEKELLLTFFMATALDIQHVGSTSVEGLLAKPILDIAIQVQALPVDGRIIEQLIANDYKERVNRLGPEQLVYVKGPEENETHILHIIPHHNRDWNDKLRFRDYLRTHPDSARAYAALKRELSQAYENQRGQYSHLKTQFIRQVLSKVEPE